MGGREEANGAEHKFRSSKNKDETSHKSSEGEVR